MTDESAGKSQPQLNKDAGNIEKDDLPVRMSPLPASSFDAQSRSVASEVPPQHFVQFDYSDPNTMDMRSIANALPEYQMHLPPQQPFQHQISSIASNSSIMYSQHQNAQFAGQTNQSYGPSFAPSYHAQYLPSHDHRQQQQHSYSQFVGNQPMQPSPQSFQGSTYPAHYGMIQNPGGVPTQLYSRPYPSQYGNLPGSRTAGGYQTPQGRQDANPAHGQPFQYYHQMQPASVRRTSSNSSLQASILRGPPRKPKQSGHALWVGNLPPGIHIIALKDHFSRDATDDIESVFLISKSNCAFVNYKTEQSCAAALSRFHDSRFQGVRLVCRLRRGSAAASGTTATIPGMSTRMTGEDNAESVTEAFPVEQTETAVEDPSESLQESIIVKERFFVVKSLTVEDLERSVQNGVWATQAHNETALNKAYQSAENVYLIFSANKSGEYFGYARMNSAINDEAAATIEFPSKAEAVQPTMSDLPLAIDTPATATAPRGRIIDDSARGTIFWEADQEEQEGQDKDDDQGNLSGEEDIGGPSMSTSTGKPQAFGKPFKIVWISTERLPFYRTRGLRNPWNSNREVKIARDGTEIEPNVGRRLISMFHRPLMDPVINYSNRPQQGMSGVPSPAGYPPQQGSMPGGMYGRPY